MTDFSDREIARHFIVGFSGDTLEDEPQFKIDLALNPPAGVILFDRRVHADNKGANIVSPNQLKTLTDGLQQQTDEPLLICVDQEGGLVQRLGRRNGFTDFTSPQQLGEINDPEVTRQQSGQMALMLKEHGINVNFAPVVDLNRNPENPIVGKIGRAYGRDPLQVHTHAAAFVEGHRTHSLFTCLKHFPGHGSSAEDSHHGFVDITKTWDQDELTPYRSLIQSGHSDMIMVGHLYNRTIDPNYPATLSRASIDLLRDKLGYTGIIVTDDLQMKAISDHYPFEEAICRAINAGIDIIIIGNNLEYADNLMSRAITSVRHGLESGWITPEVLEKSNQRIDHFLITAGN